MIRFTTCAPRISNTHWRARIAGRSVEIKLQRGVDLLAPDLTPVAVFAWNATTSIACAPSRFDELCVPVASPPL